MASEELLSCPFCGGKADPVRHAGRPAATPVCFYIECLTCRAASRWVKSLSEAAAEWNRRAQDFDAMRQRAEKAELRAEQLHAIACDLRRHATCENMGHGRLDFHGLGDPCKVLERIDAALAQQL